MAGAAGSEMDVINEVNKLVVELEAECNIGLREYQDACMNHSKLFCGANPTISREERAEFLKNRADQMLQTWSVLNAKKDKLHQLLLEMCFSGKPISLVKPHLDEQASLLLDALHKELCNPESNGFDGVYRTYMESINVYYNIGHLLKAISTLLYALTETDLAKYSCRHFNYDGALKHQLTRLINSFSTCSCSDVLIDVNQSDDVELFELPSSPRVCTNESTQHPSTPQLATDLDESKSTETQTLSTTTHESPPTCPPPRRSLSDRRPSKLVTKAPHWVAINKAILRWKCIQYELEEECNGWLQPQEQLSLSRVVDTIIQKLFNDRPDPLTIENVPQPIIEALETTRNWINDKQSSWLRQHDVDVDPAYLTPRDYNKLSFRNIIRSHDCYTILPVEGDGNCFFRAIIKSFWPRIGKDWEEHFSLQLRIWLNSEGTAPSPEDEQEVNENPPTTNGASSASTALTSNGESVPAKNGTDSKDTKTGAAISFSRYSGWIIKDVNDAKTMAKPGVWADHVQVLKMTEFLRRPIWLFRYDDVHIKMQEDSRLTIVPGENYQIGSQHIKDNDVFYLYFTPETHYETVLHLSDYQYVITVNDLCVRCEDLNTKIEDIPEHSIDVLPELVNEIISIIIDMRNFSHEIGERIRKLAAIDLETRIASARRFAQECQTILKACIMLNDFLYTDFVNGPDSLPEVLGNYGSFLKTSLNYLIQQPVKLQTYPYSKYPRAVTGDMLADIYNHTATLLDNLDAILAPSTHAEGPIKRVREDEAVDHPPKRPKHEETDPPPNNANEADVQNSGSYYEVDAKLLEERAQTTNSNFADMLFQHVRSKLRNADRQFAIVVKGGHFNVDAIASLYQACKESSEIPYPVTLRESTLSLEAAELLARLKLGNAWTVAVMDCNMADAALAFLLDADVEILNAE